MEARTGPSCQAPGDPCMMGAARWLRLRRTSLGPRRFTVTGQHPGDPTAIFTPAWPSQRGFGWCGPGKRIKGLLILAMRQEQALARALAPCVTTTLGRRSDQSRRTKRESQGAGDPCASVNPLPIGARCGREPTLIFPGMDQPDCSGSKIRGAKIKSSIFRGCGS